MHSYKIHLQKYAPISGNIEYAPCGDGNADLATNRKATISCDRLLYCDEASMSPNSQFYLSNLQWRIIAVFEKDYSSLCKYHDSPDFHLLVIKFIYDTLEFSNFLIILAQLETKFIHYKFTAFCHFNFIYYNLFLRTKKSLFITTWKYIF